MIFKGGPQRTSSFLKMTFCVIRDRESCTPPLKKWTGGGGLCSCLTVLHYSVWGVRPHFCDNIVTEVVQMSSVLLFIVGVQPHFCEVLCVLQ